MTGLYIDISDYVCTPEEEAVEEVVERLPKYTEEYVWYESRL
jgi:hypothetical protein